MNESLLEENTISHNNSKQDIPITSKTNNRNNKNSLYKYL